MQGSSAQEFTNSRTTSTGTHTYIPQGDNPSRKKKCVFGLKPKRKVCKVDLPSVVGNPVCRISRDQERSGLMRSLLNLLCEAAVVSCSCLSPHRSCQNSSSSVCRYLLSGSVSLLLAESGPRCTYRWIHGFYRQIRSGRFKGLAMNSTHDMIIKSCLSSQSHCLCASLFPLCVVPGLTPDYKFLQLQNCFSL